MPKKLSLNEKEIQWFKIKLLSCNVNLGLRFISSLNIDEWKTLRLFLINDIINDNYIFMIIYMKFDTFERNYYYDYKEED